MTEGKQSRYSVGADNETLDTIRTEVVSIQAQSAASMWAKYKYPVPFDRTFFENGKRVQVVIREVKEEHTGQGVAAG